MGKRPRGRARLLGELIEIGLGLSGEWTLDGLLYRILLQARRLTSAEAGRLFLADSGRLRLAAVQNDALAAQPGAEEMVRRLQTDGLPFSHASVAGHVALTGEMLNIRDLYRRADDASFPLSRDIDRRTGYRTGSVLAAPLAAPSGEILGVLELINARAQDVVVAFSTTDQQVVRLLVVYASVVLRNAELYRRAESRAEKLATLTRLTRLMLAARQPQRLFQEIARAAATLLGAKAARLWIDDPSAQALRMEVGFGFDSEMERLLADYPSLPYGYGAVGRVFATRTPIYIEDVLEDDRWVNRRFATQTGLHGFAGIPLSTADRTLGVLTVFFGERRHLTTEEQELLGLLADHVALVVETSLSHAQELRAARLETLNRLNQAISSSLSMAEVLRALASSTAELMQASYAWMWLADTASATLELVAASHDEFAESYPLKVRKFGEGVAGWVATQREPAMIPDIDTDQRVSERSWLKAHNARSIVALPIGVGDDFLGVLNVGGSEPIQLEDRQQLLDSLVAQAAIALRNARLYEQLRVAHEDLERSQTQLIHNEKLAALGQFVAGIAHELNNPLAALLGYAYLADRTTDVARLKDRVAKIQRSGERAAKIVRNLLQFARKSVPGDEPMDMNGLIERVLDTTADTLSISRISIVRDLSPLPVTAGNSSELYQALLNLVTNACQAMAETGGTLTVRSQAAGDKIRLAVMDTGPGIPPDIRLKIFDPFFTTKPMGTGTGLGLSVAAGIITTHGGRLWLDEVSAETTFLIELPIRRPAAAPPSLEETMVPTGRRVLVVDDEPPIAEAFADLFCELGCQVVVAHSAKAAREVLERATFDLISLDLIMPEENGADFWRDLQATRPDLAAKAVFVSGAAEPRLLRFVTATGRPTLAKPFTLPQLRTFLADQLRS